MPILSSAQFALLLWLLVAAAPMATVLLNGSMAGFPGQLIACGIVEAGAAEAQPADIKAAPAQSKLETLFRQPSQAAGAHSFPYPLLTAEPTSVLHTAVQRHRPRLA